MSAGRLLGSKRRCEKDTVFRSFSCSWRWCWLHTRFGAVGEGVPDMATRECKQADLQMGDPGFKLQPKYSMFCKTWIPLVAKTSQAQAHGWCNIAVAFPSPHLIFTKSLASQDQIQVCSSCLGQSTVVLCELMRQGQNLAEPARPGGPTPKGCWFYESKLQATKQNEELNRICRSPCDLWCYGWWITRGSTYKYHFLHLHPSLSWIFHKYVHVGILQK